MPMKACSMHRPPSPSTAPTIQHKRCESFVRISATALAVSCINKGVSRSFLVWAIPGPSLCSLAKLQELMKTSKAMGLRREDVYIANIIKCRPPGNRTPERDECETCSPFLMRQIAAIKPKVIVALGAVAAKTLLAVNAPMSELRGRWFDFRGTKLAVTYHPAFLLRDPRQKKETWKDLQMVMKELGLAVPAKAEP